MKNYIIFILIVSIYENCCHAENMNTTDNCHCLLDFKNLIYKDHPMYLTPNTEDLIYPTFNHSYRLFESGEPIELHCSKIGMLINGALNQINKLVLNCMYSYTFSFHQTEVDLRNIQCSHPIESKIRPTKHKCGQNGEKIDVGFELSDNVFVKAYLVCFNNGLQTTEYVYSIRPKLAAFGLYYSGKYLLAYKQHFSINISDVYTYYYPGMYEPAIYKQIGVNYPELCYYLGDVHVVRKYFLFEGSQTFYEFEQESSRHAINIVPMFNTCAWNLIKIAIREYAIQNHADMQIYAGTYGQVHLPHKNGTLVPIYLNNKKKKIPIPEIIWRLYYDPQNYAGLVVLVVNNYFEAYNYTTLCEDISKELFWMTQSARRYIYMCRIKDWYKVMNTSFPYFHTTKILGAELPRVEKLKVRRNE